MSRDAGPLVGSLLDEAFSEVTAKAGEGVAGKRADDDADNDVSEVVLSYEYAADRHHECPEEHPPAIGFEPFWHGGSYIGVLQASFHAEERAACQSE